MLSHCWPFRHVGFCPFPTCLLVEGMFWTLRVIKNSWWFLASCSQGSALGAEELTLGSSLCNASCPPALSSCLPTIVTGPGGEWRRGNDFSFFPHVYNERKHYNKPSKVKRFPGTLPSNTSSSCFSAPCSTRQDSPVGRVMSSAWMAGFCPCQHQGPGFLGQNDRGALTCCWEGLPT